MPPEIPKDLLRRFHQIEQTIRAVAGRQVADDLLVRDVMARRGAHFFFAFTPDHEMTITHAGKELDAVAAELLAEIANDLARLLGGDVARGKILHEAPVAAS